MTATNAAGAASESSLPFAVFKIGRAQLDTADGTAILPVTVPGKGKLSLTGKGVAKKRSARASTLLAKKKKAGTHRTTLVVKARGKVRKRLHQTGSAKVKFKIIFKPRGGAPSSQTKRLKLILR